MNDALNTRLSSKAACPAVTAQSTHRLQADLYRCRLASKIVSSHPVSCRHPHLPNGGLRIAKTWCADNGYDWAVIQKNRTITSTISHSDANPTMGIGCCQSGQVTYRVRYKTWFKWSTWFDYDLTAGQYVGMWRLSTTFDYDFEGKLYNFESGDKSSQCAFGND